MNTVTAIAQVRNKINKARNEGGKIGFVPTMGYLHDGHLSLIKISKKFADYSVMSIFVNRIQFNDPNDFNAYPRELKRDLDMAKKAGIDLVFLPDDSAMYTDHHTYVDVEILTKHLCGGHRPGHFRGVYTVVSKLFNIVQPDGAVFGQKDIQQVITIEKMVRDLNFPIKIIVAPTMREREGLAMSSRNKHLNEQNHIDALSIYKSLQTAEEMIKAGETSSEKIIAKMKEIVALGKPQKIDYISIVGYDKLQPVELLKDKSVIAVAAYFGNTRLIDNMIIEKREKDYKCIY
jgi:pantoate--beta-alanine ligase